MARRSAPKPDDISFTGDEPVILLHGKDAFLRQFYTEQVSQTLRDKHDQIDTLRFDGSSAELADVFDELRSFGLMMQHKLIILDTADQFTTKYRDALTRYTQSPESAATLLMRTERWHPGNLDKAIKKAGQVIKCDEITDSRYLIKFLQARAQSEYNRKLEPKAAGLLLEKIGPNLGRLVGELAKLALAGDPAKPIGIDEVQSLVGRSSEEDAWAIQEALLSGDATRALAKLHELIDYSGQAEQLILYFIGDLCRKLSRAAAMKAQGVPRQTIAKELKLWGPRVDPFMKAVGRHSPATLAKFLQTITDYDRRSKSGLGSARMQLEKFTALFATTLN